MSRVSGSIMIGPRGLSGFFHPLKNAIASSAVNFPCVALTRSKTATIPSQALTDRKLGIAVSAYSRFQAARKASFAGRLPAVSFWEAHDLILKAMTSHDGPFNWEGTHFHYRQVNVWPRPWQQPHPPVWMPV